MTWTRPATVISNGAIGDAQRKATTCGSSAWTSVPGPDPKMQPATVLATATPNGRQVKALSPGDMPSYNNRTP